MAFTAKFPLIFLLCVVLMAVGAVGTGVEEGLKEVGLHVVREVGHKIWEYFTSGEAMEDLSEFSEGAIEVVGNVAQAVLQS